MKKIALLFSCIIMSFVLYAGVNIKNGIYYVAYTDFVISDSIWNDIEITRAYNSRVSFSGVFGYGWGSMLETYLIASHDNSITIVWNGNGRRNIFESELTNEQSIQEEIELIIEAAYKEKEIDNPEEEIELRNRLSSNSGSRFYYYKYYRKSGFIDTIYHDLGTTFFSQACGCIGEYKPGYSYVISTEQGYDYYEYVHDNLIYSFNKQGKLVKVTSMENPNWYYTLSYENGVKIKRLDTYNGKWLIFKTDSLNRITEMHGSDTSKKAIFEYKNKGLVYSKDSGGNEYEHEYDKKYKMTKIIYNPKAINGEAEDSRKIYYNEKNYVTKIIKRDSTYLTYDYPKSSSLKYGADVKKYNEHDSLTNSGSRWWFIKINDHGNHWTYKTIEVENNDSTIRIFHEISLKPLEVKNTAGTYKYTYNPSGYLIGGIDPENNQATFVYNSANDITEIIFKGSTYLLAKDGDKYKTLILPDEYICELPLDIDKVDTASEFVNSLYQLKTLLDLCYFSLL